MTQWKILRDENGYKWYEGEVINGEPNGKGASFYKPSIVDSHENGCYTKAVESDYPDLFQVESDHNQLKAYYGDWKNGQPYGLGIMYFETNGNKSYTGGLQNGKPEGKGISWHENGIKCYDGVWKNGLKNGKGSYYNQNGIRIHTGYFEDNKPLNLDKNIDEKSCCFM